MSLKDPIARREYFKKWWHSKAGRAYVEANRERINELHRKYAKSPKGKLVAKNKAKAMMVKHKEKWLARRKLRDAVKRGKVQKLPCEVCGDVKSQGHHTDYSKPLDVIWLCQKHHTEVHKKVSDKEHYDWKVTREQDKRCKLTQEQIDKLPSLVKTKEINEIAKLYKVTPQAIKYWLLTPEERHKKNNPALFQNIYQ